MSVVRRHGRLMRTTPHGDLVNDTDLQLVSIAWRQCLDDTTSGVRSELGAIVHSVYIRGSVPRGLAIDGVSDADFIVVLHQLSPDATTRLNQLALELAARHPVASRVDIEAFELSEVRASTEYRFIRAVLKAQSLHLGGEDLRPSLPAVHLDLGLATLSQFMDVRVARARRMLQSAGDADHWIAWIMRTLVRCALELTLPAHQAYTRDLWWCATLFSRTRPDAECLIWRAVELAVSPVGDVESAIEVIDALAPLLLQMAAELGLEQVSNLTLLERKYGQ